MRYQEKLDWILDKDGKGDKDYRRNIEFVHSLGLKCDCVGWSSLDLADPRTEQILERIRTFCREDGWKARGIYTRTCVESEGDWLEIEAPFVKLSSFSGDLEAETEDGGKIELSKLRAYREGEPGPKIDRTDLLVPERFRNACIRNQIPGVSFCWMKDDGKYAAEQYFRLQCEQRIPWVGVDRGLSLQAKERIEAAGGSLPRLAQVFSTLQQILLPGCYRAEDMPHTGFAYVYIPSTHSWCGRRQILIHKDTARILLEEKALPSNALRPAYVTNEIPGCYWVEQTQPMLKLSAAFVDRMLKEYEYLKAHPRPVRVVSEKEALKVLRRAKRERKADFQKRMPNERSEALVGTEFAPLAPYYLIAEGGYLSDEYEFLPLSRAEAETAEFRANLKAEELLEDKPQGIVIAKCPDGDSVLLLTDGSVIRFSHEEPVAASQWPTLAQFFNEAIADEE